jgi:hypothetical protein
MKAYRFLTLLVVLALLLAGCGGQANSRKSTCMPGQNTFPGTPGWLYRTDGHQGQL